MISNLFIKKGQTSQIIDFYRRHEDRATVKQKYFPSLPWISPRVTDELIEIIESLGARRRIEQGNSLFPPSERLEKFSVILDGFAVRSLANPDGSGPRDISILPPMHIASGNLNFFTDRPLVSCCSALCDTTLVECDKEALRQLAFQQSELLSYLLEQFELCFLSDCLGMACRALIGTEDCIKAFLCSWAVNFGTFYRDGGHYLIRMVPLPHESLIAKLLEINSQQVKTILKRWEEQEVLYRSEETDVLSLESLEDIYSWIIKENGEGGAVGENQTLLQLMSHLY